MELRDVPGVEWVGFVDKHIALDHFIALVSECDVGCLLVRRKRAALH